MALVLADGECDLETTKSSRARSIVEVDETAFDLYRMLQSSRGTHMPCFDQHLPANSLSPSHTVVLHGEPGSGKSVLLRNLLSSYVLPQDAGGHCLPAVFIDPDHSLDLSLLARLLKVKAEHTGTAEDVVREVVSESLSRVLVFRPKEPIDLLHQLSELRAVFAENPTAGLLVVDSMSAWQSVTAAFPRSAGSVVRECWQAIARLQHESSIAAVVSYRDAGVDAPGTFLHLGVGRCPKVQGPESDPQTSLVGTATEMTGMAGKGKGMPGSMMGAWGSWGKGDWDMGWGKGGGWDSGGWDAGWSAGGWGAGQKGGFKGGWELGAQNSWEKGGWSKGGGWDKGAGCSGGYGADKGWAKGAACQGGPYRRQASSNSHSRPVLWCDVHEQLLIWAAETMTLPHNFRLSGLLALTGYFTCDHLCRILCGANLILVPIRLLGGDCGILTITSVTLSDGNPAHILRRAMYSSGTYQAIGARALGLLGVWGFGFRV
ncbi:XRCC2 [Symbiodinium natans]|uniref:XRCC2 protein n=1 Tax=Symbiodinium natans TaxID=878477 RepID=A0A812RXP0_9DINO|nr:XRCC2 [Symbiodinium natans]